MWFSDLVSLFLQDRSTNNANSIVILLDELTICINKFILKKLHSTKAVCKIQGSYGFCELCSAKKVNIENTLSALRHTAIFFPCLF